MSSSTFQASLILLSKAGLRNIIKSQRASSGLLCRLRCMLLPSINVFHNAIAHNTDCFKKNCKYSICIVLTVHSIYKPSMRTVLTQHIDFFFFKKTHFSLVTEMLIVSTGFTALLLTAENYSTSFSVICISSKIVWTHYFQC